MQANLANKKQDMQEDMILDANAMMRSKLDVD
jgi:hypothetical protein